MKNFLSLVVVFIVLFLSGCGESKEFTLNLENLNEDYIEIYEFSDSSKVYSIFSDINVKFDNGNIYSLSNALDKKLLTIDDIINKMNFYGEVNDGGTKTYESGDGFSNVEFTISKCFHSNNIIIGTDTSVAEGCRTSN